MRTPAALLSNLLDSNACDADIVDLALALPVFSHTDGLAKARGSAEPGKSLLRHAIERSAPMSLSDLDRLASTHLGGPDEAWRLANEPPLLAYLAQRLERSERSFGKNAIPLVLRILSLSTDVQIAKADRPPAPISGALLDHSASSDLGIEPFLSLALRQGSTIATARLPDGSPAILRARCPEAFEAFIAAGGDPRQDINGQPLWDALRERSSRFVHDKSLSTAIEAWAKVHESNREAKREAKEYFEQLSRYGGDEKLKARKDWHDIQDENGRSALMAVCMGHALAIKAFWSVKKAYAGAALFDNEGRGLWHAMLMHGKDAPPSTSAYLAEHAPLRLDANGRGLLPSLWSMLVHGRMSSEHEWLFDSSELARACAFAPDAHSWLACHDPKEALAFGHWLANERYLGSTSSGGFLSSARSIEILSTLAMKLDASSFCAIPAPISGAMVFNLAIADRNRFPSDEVEARIGAILSHGAHVLLSAERRALLDKRATAPARSMIEVAFVAAEERTALSASIPPAFAQPEAPGKKTRI